MRFAAIVIALAFAPQALGSDIEALVARAINGVRGSHGLPRLEAEPRLTAAARSQCLWMASVGRMEHLREFPKSFDEFRVCDHHPSNRVVKSGYFSFDELFRTERNATGVVVFPLPAANEKVGEIIARGEGGQGAYDHRTVVRGWMNSPGHRKEILKEPYRQMGVAFASPRHGETYWCVVFAHR